ncbi:MAG: hypothetical protein NC200_02180 [Candidatus Gastranaerophilales bacterium]|nr:hypothetical protein [Candidatus Gastranaerophilales bacterium]
MKKLLSTLLVLSVAGTAMAATYTENAVNKLVSPVAKKEAAATAKATQAQKDYQAKKEAAAKAQKAREEALKKQQAANKQKVETKKQQWNDLKKF